MNVWFSGFRHMDRVDLTLDQGINALTGDSGSGKTTILTGICWVIFGSGGSGPHRATKVTNKRGWSCAGIIHLGVGKNTVTFGRSSGSKLAPPPAWIPPYACEELRNFTGSSVLEFAYVDGARIDFAHARSMYFGSQVAFSSTTIVPQKLPSLLLGSGKLTHTIEELFFNDCERDSPIFYLKTIDDMMRSNKTEMLTHGGRFDILKRNSMYQQVQLESATRAVFDQFLTHGPQIVSTLTERPPVKELLSKYVESFRTVLTEAKLEYSENFPSNPTDITGLGTIALFLENAIRQREALFNAWKEKNVRLLEMKRMRETVVLPHQAFESALVQFTETLKLYGDLEDSQVSWNDIDRLRNLVESRRAKDTLVREQKSLERALIKMDFRCESLEAAHHALRAEEEYSKKRIEAVRHLQSAGATFDDLEKRARLEALSALENEENTVRGEIVKSLLCELNGTFQTLHNSVAPLYNALEISRAEAATARTHVLAHNARELAAFKLAKERREKDMQARDVARSEIASLKMELDTARACKDALVEVEKVPSTPRATPLTCPSCNETVFYCNGALTTNGISEAEFQKKARDYMNYTAEHTRISQRISSLENSILRKEVLLSSDELPIPSLKEELVPDVPSVPKRPSTFAPNMSLMIPQRAHVQVFKNLMWVLEYRRNCLSIPIDELQREIVARRAKHAYDTHVNAHGNLTDAKIMDSAHYSQLIERSAAVRSANETLLRAGESIKSMDANIDKLSAELGEEPLLSVMCECRKICKLVPVIIYFAREYQNFNNANKECEGVVETMREYERRERVLIETRDLVLRTKSAFVEKFLTLVCTTVNFILAALFDTHVAYTLTYDEKDRLVASLDFGDRKDVALTELSGGELDRYSIAVAVAFAQVRGNPFLAFDETLSSLDPEKRKDCIDAVRTALPGRPVVFVSHDLQGGLFEKIVDITNCISYHR